MSSLQELSQLLLRDSYDIVQCFYLQFADLFFFLVAAVQVVYKVLADADLIKSPPVESLLVLIIPIKIFIAVLWPLITSLIEHLPLDFFHLSSHLFILISVVLLSVSDFIFSANLAPLLHPNQPFSSNRDAYSLVLNSHSHWCAC